MIIWFEKTVLTQSAEKVVAEEREAGSVGQDNHTEVRVKRDDVGSCAKSPGVRGRHDAASVRQNHLTAFHKSLRTTHNIFIG